jgi:chromosomal replication initiator protein
VEKDYYKKEEISQIGRETNIQEDTKQSDNFITSASPHLDKHHSDEHWAQISNHIRKEIGDTAWRNWIKPLHFAGVVSEIIQLETTSRLVRDRVSSHYSDKLRIIAKTLSLPISGFEIEWSEKSLIMDANAAHTSNPPRITKMQESVRNNPALSPTHGLDPRFTFSNFIVGKPNELAFAAARRVVESATAAFNPLFLYSGVGLGKTHLMHAIAWEVNARQPSRKVMYLSAEKFMYRFIQALRHHDTMTFKEQFRSVDVLMIDDVQFISGKESTQEEFFHTFNALVDEGKQVVLSADKSPTDLSGMEERLRSRLGWGMVADIHATTYELRLGILISKRDSVLVTRCHPVK